MKTVGKYVLGRTLGKGKFSKVKEADHSETHKKYAMKILRLGDIDGDKKILDDIQKEINVMKKLKHQHIVQLHEVLLADDFVYLVMEIIDGGDLYERIVQEGKLKENDVRRYFQQLIEAIEYCHNEGVVHRDLKPENLLISMKDDFLKISDFGLSAYSDSNAVMLKTPCGTPHYLAPEVLTGKHYDGRQADIWSCGIILYAMLTGCHPFDGDGLAQLIRNVCNLNYSFPKSVPKEARDLIKKLLVVDPKKRATVDEIRKDPWFKTGLVKEYMPDKKEKRRSTLFGVIGIKSDSPSTPSSPELSSLSAHDHHTPHTPHTVPSITKKRSFSLGGLLTKNRRNSESLPPLSPFSNKSDADSNSADSPRGSQGELSDREISSPKRRSSIVDGFNLFVNKLRRYSLSTEDTRFKISIDPETALSYFQSNTDNMLSHNSHIPQDSATTTKIYMEILTKEISEMNCKETKQKGQNEIKAMFNNGVTVSFKVDTESKLKSQFFIRGKYEKGSIKQYQIMKPHIKSKLEMAFQGNYQNSNHDSEIPLHGHSASAHHDPTPEFSCDTPKLEFDILSSSLQNNLVLSESVEEGGALEAKIVHSN